MPQEPELAHPFNRRPSRESVTSTSSKVSSAEKAHAKSLRNAGKEVRCKVCAYFCISAAAAEATAVSQFCCSQQFEVCTRVCVDLL